MRDYERRAEWCRAIALSTGSFALGLAGAMLIQYSMGDRDSLAELSYVTLALAVVCIVSTVYGFICQRRHDDRMRRLNLMRVARIDHREQYARDRYDRHLDYPPLPWHQRYSTWLIACLTITAIRRFVR